jgi:hypothetical protein
MQLHQLRLNSLLTKTLPPSAIGFGENPLAASQPNVILGKAKDLDRLRLDEVIPLHSARQSKIPAAAAAAWG